LKNNIVPKTVNKSVDEILNSTFVADSSDFLEDNVKVNYDLKDIPIEEIKSILIELRKNMLKAADEMNFEKAANLRDEIKKFEVELGSQVK
jgi:excinuclease ABC subunit B